eukprot:7272053-Ditylum_brightwellii.AAC.1
MGDLERNRQKRKRGQIIARIWEFAQIWWKTRNEKEHLHRIKGSDSQENLIAMLKVLYSRKEDIP